jgi:hypothetical protein
VATHPLWRPFELADLDEAAKARVGTPPPRVITVVPYDDAWPAQFAEVEERVRGALGVRVRWGSTTSVRPRCRDWAPSR